MPLETLSPRFSSTSVIVPAAVAGTSIEALSVSSVTSGVSTSTASPAFTSTSTTVDVVEIADVGDGEIDAAHGTASSRPRGSASACASQVVKRAAMAPSMTR